MEEDPHQQRKKRKLDEPENDEEEKVEEFFALIRSTREVRDRLRMKDQKSEEKWGHRTVTAKEIRVWNPTFRPEDFLDDHENKMSGTLPRADSVRGGTSQLLAGVGASKMEEEEKDEKEDDKGGKDYSNNNLDLELAL